MGAPFDPVTRRSVAESVFDALSGAIQRGDLRAGSVLPSERVLCQQFSIARTSLREAVQGLVSLGVIERRGNRAYVAERLPGVRLDGGDDRRRQVTEIFEIRRVVELPLAQLASCRATDAERAAIAATSDKFRPQMELDEFRRLDREFHAVIAAACHNRSLEELYAKVLDILFDSTDFESLLTARQNGHVVRRLIRNAADEHAAIAHSIMSRDAPAVASAVESHLDNVEALMVAHMT